MTAQIVEIAGQKMAMLPIEDYQRLLDIVEDKADIEAAVEAEKRCAAGEEYVPADLLDRILNGEVPLRVWRKYRGMTLAQLSKSAGISIPYLSDLERNRRQGPLALWRTLAERLQVSLDDIAPIS